MTNHIHLVAIPWETHSLARALADAHMCYSQHINRKYSKVGHLWQGRFFSCVLDENHALAATRYVERNPVRAGLVGCAWDYPWSSAREHLSLGGDDIVSVRWPSRDLREQWRALLIEPGEKKEIDRVRRSTLSGIPAGEDDFLEKIEGLVKRTLKPNKVCRSLKSLQKSDL
jgi:putative transposase